LASRSITVNCIAPGFIATPMTDVLTDDQKKAILARVPADRLGMPDEIAAGVVYLASDEAAYVTGQTLHINGGMVMIGGDRLQVPDSVGFPALANGRAARYKSRKSPSPWANDSYFKDTGRTRK